MDHGRMGWNNDEKGGGRMAPAETCELTVVIPRALKEQLESEAAKAGQPLQEYAVKKLAASSRDYLHTEGVTTLSDRDWELFQSWLEEEDHQPNEALRKAFERFGGANGGVAH